MKFEVELWQIILLFIAVVGYIITNIIKHESRLTKIETSSEYIVRTLDEIKTTIKENCDLLKRHILGDKDGLDE